RRPVRARRSPAELRQTVRARLPRRDPVEQAAAGAVAAGPRRPPHARQISRGVPASHRSESAVMAMKEQLERLVDEMVTKGVRYEDAQREFEKKFITQVLLKADGNLCRAAEVLGMHRNTLSRKITEYRLRRLA